MNYELMHDAPRVAEDNFNSGLYCAESVILALAEAQGIESDILPKIATGLCGGMGRTGGQCGAITGAILGLGFAFGRNNAGESAGTAYAAVQELVVMFEREFGARNCNELLGCDLNTPEGRAAYQEKQLKKKCARFTFRATEIAAMIISNHRQE